MTYEVLVATMRQTDHSLYHAMNLHADAIIVNQCERNVFEDEMKDGHRVRWLSLRERGVGLSRNTALMRATADIVEFADDDMVFTDTCREDVLATFDAHPEADVILFGLSSLTPERPLLRIDRFARVRRMEALKYGCARMAARRDTLIHHNLSFSLLFGGGARYLSGEDTLFLQECIRVGLRIYKSPIVVAQVRRDSSSWFDGYTDRYYLDKGALMAAALPRVCTVYALLTAIKAGRFRISEARRIGKLLFEGIRKFKKLC